MDLNGYWRNFLIALQLGFHCAQFYFWYLHLERLDGIRLNYFRFGIIITFLILHLISLFFIVNFYQYPEIEQIMWVFSDFSFIALGLSIFGIFGSYLSYKSYRHTFDKRQILFFIGYVMVGIGFIILLIGAVHDFVRFTIDEPSFTVFINFGYILELIGLLFLVFIYFSNLNYVYRLPFDVHLILVAYKDSGNLISAVWLQTRNKIILNERLVSSMLTGMHSIFGEIFQSKHIIQQISGVNSSLLFEVGEDTIAVIVSQKASFYLSQALKSYLNAFERKFNAQIKARNPDMMQFASAKQLITEYFPFCAIDDEKKV